MQTTAQHDKCVLHQDMKQRMDNHGDRIVRLEQLATGQNEQICNIVAILNEIKADNRQECKNRKARDTAIVVALFGFLLWYIQTIGSAV